MRHLYLALALLYSCAAVQAAQTIFVGGATPGTPTPYTLSPSTGAATPFGVGVGPMEGMSLDTLRNRIVVTIRNTTTVMTIHPTSGAVTSLLASATILEGLAYDSNRDLLWATDQQTGNLYRMNATNGTTTLVGPLNGGTVRAGGLGFDPVSDRIYAVDDDRLYWIAPFSLIATPIGPAGFGVGFTDVDAVEFDTSTGLLYIVNDGAVVGPNPVAQHLATLNPATGLASIIGPTGLSEQFGQGMALIVPEPVALPMLMLIALAARRRRAKG